MPLAFGWTRPLVRRIEEGASHFEFAVWDAREPKWYSSDELGEFEPNGFVTVFDNPIDAEVGGPDGLNWVLYLNPELIDEAGLDSEAFIRTCSISLKSAIAPASNTQSNWLVCHASDLEQSAIRERVAQYVTCSLTESMNVPSPDYDMLLKASLVGVHASETLALKSIAISWAGYLMQHTSSAIQLQQWLNLVCQRTQMPSSLEVWQPRIESLVAMLQTRALEHQVVKRTTVGSSSNEIGRTQTQLNEIVQESFDSDATIFLENGRAEIRDNLQIGSATGLEDILKREPGLRTTLRQIDKQFGEGSIIPLSGEVLPKTEAISTGSLTLDMAMGGYGVPRGRIIEIFGPVSSGKTTLALHVCAEAQKAGGIASIVDAKHAFDTSRAKNLGVELHSLLVSQPSSGEEAMQITEMLVKSNAVDVIVIDSIAALVPRQEIEAEIGDNLIGLQARLMIHSMRKLTAAMSKSKTCVIFINDILGSLGGESYGSPDTNPAGRSLKYYASCRIDMRHLGQLKDGEVVVGQRVRAKIVKNKVAPPFRVAEFDVMHDNGISYEGDLLDLGMARKIIHRSDVWFKYRETYLGQGKERARNFLIENKHVATEIRDAIFASAGYPDRNLEDGLRNQGKVIKVENENRTERVRKIEIGEICEGTVRKVMDFGALVDIGGLNGLIHISQLSWDKIKHPSEVVKEGDKIQVRVEQIDAERGIIKLSYRSLLDNPWNDVDARFPIGAVVRGTISRLANFGAFVKLGTGIEGLIHISELAHTRVSSVASILSEGQAVEVKIMSVHRESQRIGLSLKATQAKPESASASASQPEDFEEHRREQSVRKYRGTLKGGTGSNNNGG